MEIVCTNGTIGLSKMDELVDQFFDKEVYVLVDADDAGEKLRKQFRKNSRKQSIFILIARTEK